MEYCLVTGVAGFIGSYLAEKLVKLGYNVIGIDSFNDFYSRNTKERNIKWLIKQPNFTFHEANLLTLNLSSITPCLAGRQESLNDSITIFHLAARSGVRTSWEEGFKIYFDNNVLATHKLLEASRRFKLKKFIYTSSSSVYGNIGAYCNTPLPMKENMPCNPISPYGVTKLACEHLCKLYFTNYQLPITILRYFSIYGPRQRPDMAFHKFIKAILGEKPFEIYGDGTQTRDFTYIDDAIEATIKAKDLAQAGEVYNIGGGTTTIVNKGVNILEKIIGRPAKLSYIEKSKGDIQHTLSDISKSIKTLGYHPIWTLEKGLKEEIKWLSAQN
ncbi:GDP-mannose 4,6-dehydratase [candidate division WOR-3 bacterium]|nr:GDP-mannose 4,6-dehydratase [candidate division WOR-3 bacterium]